MDVGRCDVWSYSNGVCFSLHTSLFRGDAIEMTVCSKSILFILIYLTYIPRVIVVHSSSVHIIVKFKKVVITIFHQNQITCSDSEIILWYEMYVALNCWTCLNNNSFSLVSSSFQVCLTLSGTERPCLRSYDFHRGGTHAQVSADLKYPQFLVTWNGTSNNLTSISNSSIWRVIHLALWLVR